MKPAVIFRYAVVCTLLMILACGAGSGSGGETAQVKVEETPNGDKVMNQAEQDRRIDYIEFQTTNIVESKRFFAAVFGWEFTDYGPEYASFNDGRVVGGFSAAAQVQNGSPLIVLYSANLEAIEAQVKKNGGQIVRETYTFPGGRRFHFKDPGGNELAIWSEQ